MGVMNVGLPPEEEDGGENVGVRVPCPLHGDVLELTLSHVPLIHLVAASQVSKSWQRAVASSLLHLSRPKPWLLLHSVSTRSHSVTATCAYDPRSHLWMELQPPSIPTPILAVRSSHSPLLYALTPSSFSFSHDPLNLTWYHAPPPKVWRIDPVVALIGRHIVVAGGVCDFEDDPLAVENFNMETGEWSQCGSMPALLRYSSSSAWLSVATDADRMYVVEKSSGRAYSYGPETGTWGGPHDLRPAPDVFQVAIACAGGGVMAVVGVIGEAEEVRGVKLWVADVETWETREVGEMGEDMVEELKDRNGCIWSIGVCGSRGTGYVYNPSGGVGVVRWETVVEQGVVKWESVRNAGENGSVNVMDRMVWRCGDVGVNELQTTALADRKFRVKRVVTRGGRSTVKTEHGGSGRSEGPGETGVQTRVNGRP